METLLIIAHYAICFFLIISILLQAGRGADLGAVFGGGSQTVFGSRGPATFLNKMTAIVAAAFLITSVWLAQISKTKSITSVIDKTPIVEQVNTQEVQTDSIDEKTDEPVTNLEETETTKKSDQ